MSVCLHALQREKKDICFPFAHAVQIGWWDLWHFSEKSLLWRDSGSGFSHAFFFSLTSHPKLLCLPPLDWKVWSLCPHSFSDSKGSHSFLWGVFFFFLFSCPAYQNLKHTCTSLALLLMSMAALLSKSLLPCPLLISTNISSPLLLRCSRKAPLLQYNMGPQSLLQV